MAADNKLSLGEFLRQEREKKGMTIEQVASATKINVRLLHALEADQYKDLPAKPFIRGFVTSYCRFVGIDPREVLTQFASYIDTRAHDRPSRESGHSGYAFEKREGEQNSRLILGATMGVFALAGVILLLMKPSLRKHGSHLDKLRSPHTQVSAAPSVTVSPSILPSSAPQPSGSPVAPSPSPSPTPSTLPSPEAKQTSSPDDPLNSGINLKPAEIKHKTKFRALESIWVRYQVDNRPPMQFILRKGKALVLRAETVIKFQVSNPAHIVFSYNNQSNVIGSESKDKAMRQNDATFIFPPSMTESIQEPFPKERPLSSRAIPKSPTSVPASPSPTPSN